MKEKLEVPLFSITTPCWNSAKTIERTIKSVLSQDFKDYEYIIVDGGSTDGTIDIIKKYEPLFEGRMHWKSEPDKGLYDAFNKGVERSTGIYCWNVNSDDFIESNALEVLSSIISGFDSMNLPIISGAMNFCTEYGKILRIIRMNEKDCHAAYKMDYMGVNHPATLVPKSVYNQVGAFDSRFKISGDIDWFHRAYKAGCSFFYIDEVITNMCDGGISNQFVYKKSAKDRILFLRKKYSNPFIIVYKFLRWTNFFIEYKKEHNREKK